MEIKKFRKHLCIVGIPPRSCRRKLLRIAVHIIMSPKADDSKYTVLVGKMLTCFSYARENHLSKTVFVTCRNDIHKVRGVKISEVVYLQDVSLIKRDYKELTMRITI